MSPLIENVSDTARWVAMYRAIESARPDALFRDPYAGRLAGERGQRIVDGMPGGRSFGWPMVVRTRVFDDIIEREIAAGIDRVVNLAAGLDMRPTGSRCPRHSSGSTSTCRPSPPRKPRSSRPRRRAAASRASPPISPILLHVATRSRAPCRARRARS